MSRLLRSGTAGFLTVLLCLGIAAGPAFAEQKPVDSTTPALDAARPALSGLITLLIGAGLVLLARQGPNGPGFRRT